MAALTAALREISGMDPEGLRADDLGRAARVARAALADGAGQMPVERIAMLWNSLPLETDPQSVVAFARAIEKFHGITEPNTTVARAFEIADKQMLVVLRSYGHKMADETGEPERYGFPTGYGRHEFEEAVQWLEQRGLVERFTKGWGGKRVRVLLKGAT